MANEIMSVEGQLVGMPTAGPESFSQQQLDYLKRALGVDETVLWEGTATGSNTISLSESMANFETIKILYNPWSDNTCTHYFEFDYNKRSTTMNYGIISDISVYTESTLRLFFVSFAFTDTTLSVSHINYCDGSFTVQQLDKSKVKIYKVVGTHRIAGGN